MENLHYGNFRYDLFVTRLQGIKPSSSKNLLFKTLKNISQSDAIAAGGSTSSLAISPLIEVENPQIASLVAAYEQECRRVALFYRSQHQQLWNALLEIVGLLRSKSDTLLNPAAAALSADSHRQSGRIEKVTTLRALLDALGEKAVALDAFGKANIEAAAELALLGDGKRQSIATSSAFSLPLSSTLVNNEDMDQVFRDYSAAAEAALLGMLRLDPVILGLSDAYALLSLVEESQAEGIAAASAAAAAAAAGMCNANGSTIHSSSSSSLNRWVAPQKFKRTTRKFWLKLSDVALFKTEVIKHLPILVYGNRLKITEIDDPADLAFTLPTLSESDASPISSVYLDSLAAGLPSYHSRLRREDGATAVRLRWYGERNPEDPFQQIFVEKKVHVVGGTVPIDNSEQLKSQEPQQQQRQAGQSESEKQRVSLPQSEIPALLSGQPVAIPKSFSKEDYEFLQEVQMYISEDSHAPVLRTCYNRTAFQHDSHNRVRISMDTNLRMVRDYIPSIQSTNSTSSMNNGCGAAGQWCRSDAEIASAGAMDTVYFPYAVVEVKLQVNPPEWLQELVRKEILLAVPKFSKFLHGTAMLYQQYVENVPHWFLSNPNYNNSTSAAMYDLLQQQQLKQQHLPLTPATWEEMIGPSAEAVSDAALWLFPASTSGSDGGGNGNQKEEEERRVTQAKPGLLSRLRGAGRRGQQQSFGRNDVSSSVPVNIPHTANNAGSDVNSEEKYEAPGTPDGASPRADLALPGNPTLQNQMMLELMMNSDSSSVMTSNLTSNRSVGGHRLSSSPTSSASVSSLVSSAEGLATNSNTSNTHSGSNCGSGGDTSPIEQDQVHQKQRMPSWQVFQEPALSPVAPVAVAAAVTAGQGRNETDLESGVAGTGVNGGDNALTPAATISLSPPIGVVISPAAVGAGAAVEGAATKPTSRKSSLVHLVSSIPGLGAISGATRQHKNEENNTSSNTAAGKAPGDLENSGNGYHPMMIELAHGKKEPPLLPSYSIISSPSSLPGNPRGGSNASVPPRAMVRTRVEPKTFFANERTFLQWLQISVLVMFLGLNLLNGSMLLPGGSSSSSSSSGICASNDSKCIASKISGALIAPVALLFMAYSLFMYRQRTRQILRRESVRYDDQRGPAILVAILLTVMLISYVIAMIYVF